MDGCVILVNPDTKLAAARTRYGEYTVFEVLGNFLIKIGDLVSGKLETHGETKLVNLSQRVLLPVKIKDTKCKVAHRVKYIINNNPEKLALS